MSPRGARAVVSVCMGLWLGAALFFTLAAAPVALRVLPVAVFGRLVTALLPAYFAAGAAAGAVALAAVLAAAGRHPRQSAPLTPGAEPGMDGAAAAAARWRARRPMLAVLSGVVLAANLYVDLALLPPMTALENRLLPAPWAGNPLWGVFFRLHGEAMGANLLAMLVAAVAWGSVLLIQGA